jgi:phage minor structural protein GP20|nr:MAG TPA: minor structural protein [Caudoviricetes sp.]
MDFKEYLQSKGLNVATAEDIINGMAEHKLYTTNEENAGTRLSKAKEKNKQYEEDLRNANTLIEELKKNSVSAEDMKAKLTDYERQIEELNSQRQADKLNNYIDLGLTSANVRNLKAVKALLNMDSIKANDKGEFEGLTEQLDALKESDGYLFNASEPEQSNAPRFAGGNPNNEPKLSELDQALFNGFDNV